jgi:acetylornithine deacetylase
MDETTQELVSLTERLVRIPSHDDETAAGDAIEEWLRAHTDADVTRDDAGNVLAEKSPGDGDEFEHSLALVGHHDVVPPAASQVDTRDDDGDPTAYTVEERDGRLYGRGTADMKGAVAAAMLAFRDADPGRPLHFVSFVGEEIGGEGARAYLDRTSEDERFTHAIVGEGSTNYSGDGVTDVAVAHKGRRGSTITATGRAAHASEPEAGENAIYRASDAVDVVRGLEFPEAEVFGESLRGSVAVTEIEGGSAWNVIPEECTVTVDERTVPGVRADLESVEELDGVSWTVDQDLPPMACEDEAFADEVLAAAIDAHEVEEATGAPELVTKPHATDAGWLSGAGIDCVVCGPAEPGNAHTDSESVAVAVLARCYRTYRNAAERR